MKHYLLFIFVNLAYLSGARKRDDYVYKHAIAKLSSYEDWQSYVDIQSFALLKFGTFKLLIAIFSLNSNKLGCLTSAIGRFRRNFDCNLSGHVVEHDFG